MISRHIFFSRVERDLSCNGGGGGVGRSEVIPYIRAIMANAEVERGDKRVSELCANGGIPRCGEATWVFRGKERVGEWRREWGGASRVREGGVGRGGSL